MTDRVDVSWRDWPDPAPGEAPDSVAILGKMRGTSRFVPWGEPGWEFWGLNHANPYPGAPIEAHTRWFQLHSPRYLGRHHPPGLWDLGDHWTWERGVRLYMDRHYKKYPDSEPYPKAEVEGLVPHGEYHASSLDWMVGLAVLEGFSRIALYGIDVRAGPVLNGEPISARPCLEYWAGVAEGRGATVKVHDHRSDRSLPGGLFRVVHLAHRVSGDQYGFDTEPGFRLPDGWRDLR